MITQKAWEKGQDAQKIASASFALFCELITQNGFSPEEALERIHGSDVYYNLWARDLWVIHEEELYRRFCRVENITPNLDFKAWQIKDVDYWEYAINAFETYRFLTQGFVSGGALELLFSECDLYNFLRNRFLNNKQESEFKVAVALEKEIERQGSMAPQFKLMEIFQETEMERFFRKNGNTQER